MRARHAAALAVLAFAAFPASAGARDAPPVIEQMAVRITVAADSTLHVTESIVATPASLGAFAVRRIPLRAPDGRLVRIRDVHARDGSGAMVTLDARERDDVVEVGPRALALTDAGDIEMRLAYTVYRAVQSLGAVDRLDWAVLPSEWNARVKSVRVAVEFPPSLRSTRTVQATLARADNTPLPTTIVRGDGVVTLDASLLRPGERARLAMVWPAGHVSFTAPEPPRLWPRWLRLTQVWLVPAALLGVTGLVWMTGRGGRAVVPQYEPPAGLRPGEAGVIIDGRIHGEDLVAAIADLALRGYLALEREPGGTDVTVTVRRSWISDRDVRPWEAMLLANVFTDGLPSTRLSALRGPRDTAAIREALSAELAEHGFFASAPLAVRRVGRWLAVIAAAVWIQLAWNARADASTIAAGVATGVVLWLLAGVVAAGGLTAQGRRARQALRGFREFLARVDRPRLERLPAGTLDPHLAWAIALGVTESWLAETPTRTAVR